MFEVDSADMCAGKFLLLSKVAEQRVSRAQTQERGPPSALAEILYPTLMLQLAQWQEIQLIHITKTILEKGFK